MIEAGIDGALLRDGSSPGVYYTAQTDPDWADYPFPNAAYKPEAADTIRDRACGVMSMTMVGSTYLHRELDPTMLVDYVLENGWRIAASGVDDTFMQEAARLLGLPQPDIFCQAPAEGQQPIDWEQVRQVVENGGMAIAHETRGNFSPAQHYVVLTDYIEKDGTGYFLVTDPYQSRRRYYQWDTDMADPGLVAQACSAVILFEENQDHWELVSRSAAPFELLPGER